MPVISALRLLRQEDQEFKASLSYIVRPVPTKQSKTAPGFFEKQRYCHFKLLEFFLKS
jgi:hypothetical protein